MKLRLCLALLSSTLLLGLARGEGEDVVHVGEAAPVFVAPASDGTSVDLAALKGQVVLLDFFATWCPPCRAEMPALESQVWAPLHGKGLMVVAIGRQHTVAEVAAFKEQNKLSFTFAADPDREIYKKYATGYIPRCYLVGKDGTVKAATVGYDEAEFAQFVKQVEAELAR